ncbi:PREDICTED: specifically androgen-regulated gene protein isoform X4 [Myotis davidii]|uniref:specifically androgen-regulated gene protein isoform X4 n=1 Tax=Myotis davidii TaxID=225400 RepID=UPI000767BA9D|nr:PREDICTED: specifically androgen-regulated gene protein isoform X4 [Myotis davidii]
MKHLPVQAQLGTFFASPRFPSGSPFRRPCTLLLAMPERELWPEGPGSEPVTRIGSWDSMTSTTSTRSGSTDSYDFLSAEEKECLLFLEETIGSLDTEADSGLSTEESEQDTTPESPRALPPLQPAPQGHPEETVAQQRPEPRRANQSSIPPLPEPQSLGFRYGSFSLPRNIHISRNQNFRKSTPQTNSHLPGEPNRVIPDPREEQLSQSREPSQAPVQRVIPDPREQQISQSREPSQAPVQRVIPDPRDEQLSQSRDPSQDPAGLQEAVLDLDTTLIPPPEAFRDAQPEQRGEDSPPTGPGERTPVPQLLTSLSPQKRKETSSEAMSQKANEKGPTGAPGQPRPLPAVSSQNTRAADASVPPGRDPNAQVAPLTGPKPRKLPPNIVLKSSRSSFHSDPQPWLSRHPEAAPGDSGLVSSSLQEQRKARKEALEKLGLPLDQEKPSPHLSKPPSSIRLKGTGTQAPAPAPASAPALAQPAPQVSAGKALAPAPTRGPSPMKALAPALAQGSAPGKVFIPAQEPTPGKVPAAKSMPILIPRAPGVRNPLTLQESSIPGLRQMNFKSNTLERSGVGLSSYLSAEKDPSSKASSSLGKDSFLNKLSPNVLRNSRPRPASLGTGKDFAGIQVSMLADHEQSSKRLSYQGQSRDKLPRPTCVSVKISPKGIPDEHRKEALKKLGLWKE